MNEAYQWGKTDLRETSGRYTFWIFNRLVFKCLWVHWMWWQASVNPAPRAHRQKDHRARMRQDWTTQEDPDSKYKIDEMKQNVAEP